MRPPKDQVGYAQLYGKKYGVDPRLLLAIGGHETHWGTLGAGRQGYTLGYGATDSGTISKYAGAQNQYRWAAQTLAKWGVHSLQDILAGKAASYATDPHWEQGVAGTYREIGSFGGGTEAPLTGSAPAPPGQQASSAPGGNPQLQAMLARYLSNRGQRPDWYALAAAKRKGDSPAARAAGVPGLSTMPMSPGQKLPVENMPNKAGVGPPVHALAEAFYDPLGSWDNGRFGGPIGHHNDHVHLSITNPQVMLAAIAHARQVGLHVGENPYLDHVDPVHVKGSFHYRDFPGKYNGRRLGEAIDVSGDAKKMAAYYRWATSRLR